MCNLPVLDRGSELSQHCVLFVDSCTLWLCCLIISQPLRMCLICIDAVIGVQALLFYFAASFRVLRRFARSFLYFAFRHGTVAKSNKVSGDNSRRPPEVTFFLRQTQVTPFGIMILFIHFPTPDLGHPLGSIVFSVHFFLTPDLGDPLIRFVVFFIYFPTQDLGHPLDLLYFSYICPTPDEGHPHLDL